MPFSRNAATTEALTRIGDAASQGVSNDDLARTLETVAADTPRLEYRNFGLIVTAAIAVLVPALLTASDIHRIDRYLPWLWGAGWMSLALIVRIFVQRRSRIRRVQARVQHLHSINCLGLKVERFNPRHKALELAADCAEFARGNQLREVTALYTGSFMSKSGETPYELVYFHWTTQRVVEETHRDNRGTSRRRRVKRTLHHFRTSLIVNVDLGIELKVQSSATGNVGISWTSSSSKFNEIYQVTAESEQVAAKVLKPAMILQLEDLASLVSKPNVEFTRGGKLVLSFRNPDVLRSDGQIDIQVPAEAARQVADCGSHELMMRLQGALEQISRYAVSELSRDRPPPL